MSKNKIHIDPSKRGTFTSAANKRNKTVKQFTNMVLSNKDKYSPKMVKKAVFARNASKWNKKREGGDIVSTMGYRDDSPFRNSKSLNIYSPEGYIDMSNVSRPIMANGQRLEPNSGLNQVPPSSSGYVKETPLIAQNGKSIVRLSPKELENRIKLRDSLNQPKYYNNRRINTWGFVSPEELDIVTGGGINFPSGTGVNALGIIPKTKDPVYKGMGMLGVSQQLGPNWNIGAEVSSPFLRDWETKKLQTNIQPSLKARYNIPYTQNKPKRKSSKYLQNGGSVPIIPTYYQDSGTPIYRDTTDAPPTVYQKGGNIYNVKSGDTFYGIANRHNMSKQNLIDANPSININALKLNQPINIPLRPSDGLDYQVYNNKGKSYRPDYFYRKAGNYWQIKGPNTEGKYVTITNPTRLSNIDRDARVFEDPRYMMPEVLPQEYLDHLQLREGMKNKSYLDSEGKLTGGTGHLMSAAEKKQYPLGTSIPPSVIEKWYKEDSKKAYKAALKQAKELKVDNPKFINSLASVNFQLGPAWNTKHTETWKLLKAGEYEKAAIEAADSKWNTQTPKRVKDFQEGISNLYKYGGAMISKKNIYQTGGPVSPKKLTENEKYRLSLLNKYMDKYGITNPHVKTAMLGVIESEGGLEGRPEYMNYSPGRLAEVWAKFSKTGKKIEKGKGKYNYNKLAEEYSADPQKLANFIYGNRLGNRGSNTNDGWTYRGRGMNQLTGRGSYEKLGKLIGVDLVNNPELLNTDPDVQAHVAVMFLYNRIANQLPKLVAGKGKDKTGTSYKERFSKYVDFNNLTSLKDANYLLTSANSGFGNNRGTEHYNKRLRRGKPFLNYFLDPNSEEYIKNIESNIKEPIKSKPNNKTGRLNKSHALTYNKIPENQQRIINDLPVNEQFNILEDLKNREDIKIVDIDNSINNQINQLNLEDVKLAKKNPYIDKLNVSMPVPKQRVQFGQGQLFKKYGGNIKKY